MVKIAGFKYVYTLYRQQVFSYCPLLYGRPNAGRGRIPRGFLFAFILVTASYVRAGALKKLGFAYNALGVSEFTQKLEIHTGIRFYRQRR